ncbi:MAG: hypothetical protein KA387_00305 [Rubrivivax sp.]|nr:hypothetical protein [Rubrivivax sp.]
MSRRWPWVLGALLLLAGAALALAWIGISALHPLPFSVVVDGERVFEGIDLGSMDPALKLLLAALFAFVLLAALIIVPVALLLTLLGLLVAALAIVGLPLLVACVLLAALLSPLWLILWLLFKLLA